MIRNHGLQFGANARIQLIGVILAGVVTVGLFMGLSVLVSVENSFSSPNYAFADEEEGDYTYTVSDGQATITRYNGTGGAVVIPSTLGGYPVTAIGEFSFDTIPAVTSVTIPDSVTSIGNSAFACTGITNVTIPDNVTYLEKYAFYGCTELEHVTIGSGLTSISESLFSGCSSLESVSIPSGVASIGRCAFADCASLSYAVIPGSVSSIDEYAFDGCSALENLYYVGSEARWNAVSKGTDWNHNGPAGQTIHYLLTITISANPAGAGEVSISPASNGFLAGTYESGTEITVTATPGSGYAFGGWEEGGATVSNDAVYTFVVADNCALTAVFTVGAAPTIEGHNLLLASEIGVQFKVVFPDGFDATGVYMSFAVADGRTGTMQLASATPISGQNAYWFTAYVNALELADTVTATLHYSGGELTDEYSAVAYVAAAKQVYPDNVKLIALVDALQNYGYYMQQSGWTDSKTHTPIEQVSVLGTDDFAAALAGVADKAVVKELEGSGIEDAKFGLTLNAQTIINVYVKPADGVSIVSPSPDGTQTIGGATYYRFDTTKIGAGDLAKVYTIAVTTDEGTAYVRVSAMSYVHSVLNGTSFTEAKQYAMVAYYNYCAAAKAY